MNFTYCIHSDVTLFRVYSVCSDMSEFLWQSWSHSASRQVGQSHGQYDTGPQSSHFSHLVTRISATHPERYISSYNQPSWEYESHKFSSWMPEKININEQANKNRVISSQLPKVGMLALCLQPTPATATLHLLVKKSTTPISKTTVL